MMQIVVLTDLFLRKLLLLGLHYELFELDDNRHGISLANHQKEIEIIAINYNKYIYIYN